MAAREALGDVLMANSRAWLRVMRQDALSEQRGRCIYCKAPLSLRNATADHLKPRCRGGTYAKENIVAACGPCNRAKGSLSEGQFFKMIRRDLPSGQPPAIIAIWASRRIWRRAHRACERIEKYSK